MTTYGKDIATSANGILTSRYSTGVRLVAEAIERRLSTGKGELIDDPNYGLDLLDYVGNTTTPGERAILGAKIRAEILKDERLESATIDVAMDGDDLLITIESETAEGPFELVLSVSQVTLTMVGFETT